MCNKCCNKECPKCNGEGNLKALRELIEKDTVRKPKDSKVS